MSTTTELHSVEFEQAICGALMTDPHCYPEIEATGLTSGDFRSPSRGVFFDWLVLRITEGLPVEMSIVVEELMSRTDKARFPGWKEVSAMPDRAFSYNAGHYAERLVALSFQRRGLAALATLQGDFARPETPSIDLLARAERTLQSLAGGVGGRSEWTTGNDLATLMWTDIQARIEARKAGAVVGMPWGLEEIDRDNPPMSPGRMYLLAARPGMGKSSLALQILQTAVARGEAVALFNLEMEEDGVGRKLIALATGLPTAPLRDGDLSDADVRRAQGGLAAMSQWPLYLDTTPAQSIERIASKARRLASQLRHTDTPLKLLMVDYAQLIRSEGLNSQDKLAAVSQGLLELGKELQVPVVALAQLNRKCEDRTDKRPHLADLRGSGQWEQDAHAIVFLYREAYYDALCGHNETEFIVAKWRDHETGTQRISWNGSTQRFGVVRPRAVAK